MKVVVSNIQRMCFHDGPGIRTTVFFKGCNLKCPWCANPENISFEVESYLYQDKNITYGKMMSLDEIYEEILKDKLYYENLGGVTFSGGEPLLKFDDIEPLLKRLKDNNINVCIETSLMVPQKYVNIALKYVDTYIIDIKILDSSISKNIINGNTDKFYENVDKIFKNNADVIFRIPLEKDYIASEKNIEKILDLLRVYKPKVVEVFKLHNLANSKYKILGKELPESRTIEYDEIEKIKEKIEELNIKVIICELS